ncbi:MAG: UDP-N-acetylglucosamine 2-epimerase (non-hydrolyzing) [Gemmataceae bacterium]
MPFRLIAVVGARPNFMKIAPLMWAIRQRSDFDACLVHTGQHYDEKMSGRFFDELRIPTPDVNLEVGSGSHAVQTAEIMKRFEPVMQSRSPQAVVVVGDVNSTLACALVSVKLHVPVAHVEAGLRSFDRSMPEEINRILTDAMSDWLFVPEPAGVANLRREGVGESKIHYVGNVMIDTLAASLPRIHASPILDAFGLKPKEYGVLTLHRPSNVDRPESLDRLLSAISRLQSEIPFVFPIHPRTESLLRSRPFNLSHVRFVEPMGYLDFMKLVADSRLVLTDSGGVQEETTYLGVPCLTMRLSTERPSTIEHGTNQLVGLDSEAIVAAGLSVLRGEMKAGKLLDTWDGHASERILGILANPATYPTNI